MKRKRWTTAIGVATAVGALASTLISSLFPTFEFGTEVQRLTIDGKVDPVIEVIIDTDRPRENSRLRDAQVIKKLVTSGVAGIGLDIFYGPGNDVNPDTNALRTVLANTSVPIAYVLGNAKHAKEAEDKDDKKHPDIVRSLPAVFRFPPKRAIPQNRSNLTPVVTMGQAGDVGRAVADYFVAARIDGQVVVSLALWALAVKAGVLPSDVKWDFDNQTFRIRNSDFGYHNGKVPLFMPSDIESTDIGYVTSLELLQMTDDDARSKYFGKIVFYGLEGDTQSVPRSSKQFFGTELNAYAANSLFYQSKSRPFTYPGALVKFSWALFLCLCAAIVSLSSMRFLARLAVIALLVTLASFGPSLAFKVGLVRWELLAPLVGVVLTSLTSLALLGKSADRIAENDTFSAACLVVDIQDSVPLDLKLGSHDAGELKTNFLNRLTQIATASRGYIESSTGDGFYCYFREAKLEEAISRALTVARKMQGRASESQDLETEFGVKLSIRITLEAGRLTSRVLTSGREISTTSGLAVDIAHRLQALAKEHGAAILCGPQFGAWVPEECKTLLGSVPIKGLADPINIFQVK